MSTRVNQIENLQQIEAIVAGPDGATRLYTIAGRLGDGVNRLLGAGEGRPGFDTFTCLIGPTFTRQQFVRAIASAWVTTTKFSLVVQPTLNLALGIKEVDADWDDESGRVELRIEVFVQIGEPTSVADINSLGFQVTILAAVAP
jgi:hypothetical protein